MSVNPPVRPNQLANNHAWRNQINIGEELLAAARGGQAGPQTREIRCKEDQCVCVWGVQVAARWTAHCPHCPRFNPRADVRTSLQTAATGAMPVLNRLRPLLPAQWLRVQMAAYT